MIFENWIYKLRCLHGKMHEFRIGFQNNRPLRYYLGNVFSRKVVVIGTPSHTNIGDSAIVLAEIDFLKHCGYSSEQIKELTVDEVNNPDFGFITDYIRAMTRCSVAWHGGGNLGDQWIFEERFRRRAMEVLKKKKMVIFPQTIFYSNTEKGKIEEERSVQYYNNCKNLLMVARERQSEAIMKHLYESPQIMLAPDIVLSATMDQFGAVLERRKGVLFCIRQDTEKAVSESVWNSLRDLVVSMSKIIRYTDMYSDCQVTKKNRAECVRKKMQEFCSAELVITDRLHAMVFSALTGTPCIAFSNNNHKVKGTYEWISYLPYIRYAERIEDAERYIPELLKMKDCKFDNTPLKPYYDKLAEVVKEKCRR